MTIVNASDQHGGQARLPFVHAPMAAVSAEVVPTRFRSCVSIVTIAWMFDDKVWVRV
jgi:hypothetical protein